jgi:endonuclease YncB( thermonuclease family)
MRSSLFAAILVLACAPAAVGHEISSYAFVNNDATIRMKGRIYRLFGLYIPSTPNVCQQFTLPPECASQASLSLQFRIGPHFVHCRTVADYPDRTFGAFCDVEGADLGAYMVNEGWALALPEGPVEYTLMERIARARGFGVWSSPLYNIYRFPP